MNGLEGLVAVRQWMAEDDIPYFSAGVPMILPDKPTPLRSISQDTIWHHRILEADGKPEIWNDNGVYALLYPYDLNTNPDWTTGVVELRGQIIEHGDHVVRAQWAMIMELFLPEEVATDDRISLYHALYGVPMVVTDDIVKTVDVWSEGRGGPHLKCNETLLEEFGRSIREEEFGKSIREAFGLPVVTFEQHLKSGGP